MIGAYYDTVFAAARAQGLPVEMAADYTASAFLNGKPTRHGKRKSSGADRQSAF